MTKRSLFIGAVFSALLTLNGSLVYAYPGEARVLSREALKEYNTGNFARAEDLYSSATAKAPAEVALKYDLGAAYVKNGKLGEAAETFKSVYDERNPQLNAHARYNSGVAHHEIARKSIAAGEKANDPKGLAGVRDTAIKELELAIDDYRTAILGAPRDEEMKFNYELARKQLEELKRQEEGASAGRRGWTELSARNQQSNPIVISNLERLAHRSLALA